MNNEVARISLSLSLRNNYQRGGQAGLSLACSPIRSPKGGLRLSSDLCDWRAD